MSRYWGGNLGCGGRRRGSPLAADAVKRARIVRAAGVEQLRHGIGYNLAIYHRDPDDHIVEFYAELDWMKSEELGYFDPRPWREDHPQRPKVWKRDGAMVWGMPPAPNYLRSRSPMPEH